MKRSKAFTLIELLIVISIIAILMSLLVPSMGAAIQTIKIRDTQRRITTLHKAVEAYQQVYAALPLDWSPDRTNSNPNNEKCYPPTATADAVYDDLHTSSNPEHVYIFYHDQWNDQPNGGKYLAYFLMGPNGNGWHRPKTTAHDDPNYRMRNISAEWDPPDALNSILNNGPVTQGGATDYPAPIFVDAFTLEGRTGGIIAYGRARKRATGAKFSNSNSCWTPCFYWSVRSHPSYPGDGQSGDHFQKIAKQCPYDFMLLSPGPNGKFGYHVYGGYLNGQYLKGWWGNVENGISDDIANFPIQ